MARLEESGHKEIDDISARVAENVDQRSVAIVEDPTEQTPFGGLGRTVLLLEL